MSRRKKYTIEEVKNFVKNKNGECLSNIYINNKKDLLFLCNVCKNKWSTDFKSIKINNQWCPYCSGRFNNNINVAKKIANERNGECLSLEYINNKTNLIWKCNICKCTWDARLDRIKYGTWCPKCKSSHGERLISKYLDSKNIHYFREYLLSNNQRFDFYLPKFNIAIEFDGIQHFQLYGIYTSTEESLKKVQKFDIKKTIYCIDNNIKFLRICYTEIKILCHIIDLFLDSSKILFLSNINKYDYIINNIPINTIFITLLNGNR
uniref:Homing endonuclease n=1 Tax=viral metagenome TaxID=1070528 RepID=A0A6C0CZ33_9ZZZZ